MGKILSLNAEGTIVNKKNEACYYIGCSGLKDTFKQINIISMVIKALKKKKSGAR